MKNNYHSIVLFLMIQCAFGQNLVINPSFEDYHDCPRDISFFHKNVKFWSIPNNGTTDYFNVCSSKMGINNFNGKQKPRTGNGFAGIYTYARKNYREYIQGKLSTYLERGKLYEISFYASLAEKSSFAIKHFGILLSNKKFKNNGSDKFINAKPIVKRIPTLSYIPKYQKAFIKDKENWVKISVKYKAKGFENYFIIGNFESNSVIKLEKQGDSKIEPTAYYYIDDVSVELLEPNSKLESVELKEKPIKFKPDTTYIFNNVHFDFDKAVLLETSKSELNILLQHLKKHQNVRVEIYGHTDNVGQKTHNKNLSHQRAKAVAMYLRNSGVEDTRVTFIGLSSAKPIADNKTEEGRQENRRVEFKLIKN